MEHVSLEILARLVDEAPTGEVAEHLAACAACRDELEALREQTRALAELPDLRPPQGDWAELQARLSSEGLLRPDPRLRSWGATPVWMKAAAALILFVGGAGMGMGLSARLAAPGPSGAAVASTGASPFTLTADQVGTLEEAEEAVRLAERRYMDALVQYRQLVQADGVAGSATPESRLAALEYLVAAGKAAVQRAPTDPFLNGFLASAMAERQATVQAAQTAAGAADDWY